MKFDDAFKRLIGHEGALSDDPNDPGGLTKYGISQRSYPNVDIKALTLDEAKSIYKRDYWNAVQMEHLPEGIRFDLFDMAVNSGVSQAVKTLQRAVGAGEDGKLGPVTIACVRDLSDAQVVARFNGARLMFMTNLMTWQHFGKGWARRIAANLLEA
jgi:lysozyme family protein